MPNKKEKVLIERELKSNSAVIIWKLISTDSGLSRWVADNVRFDGDMLEFTWGDIQSRHETKRATLLGRKSQKYLRWRWEGDDERCFTELKMEKSDLTNDYILTVTDFAEPDETDALRDIWEDSFDRLRQNSGL